LSNPLVSVVITTKNEELNISRCLDSIFEQSYKNIEVIVVDNFSSDNTVEIAKKYTDNVYLFGPERSAQRNYGMISKSTGKYVIYIDADMILSPSLIMDSSEFMENNPNIVGLYLGEIILGVRFFSKVRRFEREFYDGTPIDGVRFFKRSCFVEVGGFDEITFKYGSGEDWDIGKSLKLKGDIAMLDKFCGSGASDWSWKKYIEKRGVKYNPRYCGFYHDESEINLKKYFLKKKYYSTGFLGYKEKWGNDDDIKCQLGFMSRYFWIFMKNNGWIKLVKNPQLTVGLYFLRIIVGIAYLKTLLEMK